jgi:signal transduction histidine kinase
MHCSLQPVAGRLGLSHLRQLQVPGGVAAAPALYSAFAGSGGPRSRRDAPARPMASSHEDLIRLLTLTAHELRTPLSVASGYLKMLSTERLGPLGEAQRKAVVAAGKSCDQLLALASDLSTLARLERGEAALSRAPVSAASLIADAIASCVTSEQHPVTINSVGHDDVTVLVDPVRTRHSLCSLITAVARGVPDGATVTVSHVLHTDHGSPRLVVIIAQDGQADAEAAFDHRHLEPFDEWEGGLGVGLPLAQRFLRLEGGDIRALETDCPGLVVTLPVVSEPSRTA